MAESDPNGIDAHQPGAKLDAGKPDAGLLLDMGRALMAVARVGTFGAEKYSRGGWVHVKDGPNRYTAALLRHLLAEGRETIDPDSGLAHAAQVAWNALARLELLIREGEEFGAMFSFKTEQPRPSDSEAHRQAKQDCDMRRAQEAARNMIAKL